MRTELIEIMPPMGLVLPTEKLTLKPFVDYVKNVYERSNRQKQKFLSFVINRIESRLEADLCIEPGKAQEYTDLWNLVYVCTNPILEEEHAHNWAISMPVSPVFIFCTDALYHLIVDDRTGQRKKNLAELSFFEMNHDHAESCYSMILERCYGIQTQFRKEMIYPFEEEGAGVTKYYQVNFDDRYIQIYPNGELPEFSFEINEYSKEQLLKLLKEKLPLTSFRYEGICIVNVTDVTSLYSIENIKKALLYENTHRSEEYYQHVLKSLKSLANSKDVEFGMFPLITVNNKYIFDKKNSVNSQLISMLEKQGYEKENYKVFGENYLKDPRPVFFKKIDSVNVDDAQCMDVLKNSDIESYALMPIFFNSNLSGVLEIYSRKTGVLTEEVLSKIEPALPFLAQIYQRNIDEFENEIDLVIKRHFTSVQPSVQWKFNEVAWHYLRDQHRNNNKRQEIGDIEFQKVFPLYGAVDLRNSTVQRNEASRKDLHTELLVLIAILDELKLKSGFGLLDEKIFQCKKWLEKLSNSEGLTIDSRLNEYLEFEIEPFLRDFKSGNRMFAPIIDRYYQAVDPDTGPANEHRRQLETSMNQVIGAVNNYMELMKDEMQKAYPCYFEKFRTDGVEYDVYIGQSLAPEKPFSEIYLGNLRLMQLTSMAAIARYTHALQKELPAPVETTQLIFIHSHPIDILFRKDEKRFDVEGAYNIRYHIVKKRIDKVHIKGTKDRLTIPNKIALVYLTQKEADEYVSYINYLIEKGILQNDLEYLELEQLQGISGLKAMRVGVAFNEEDQPEIAV